jgi:hypothetical protein
VGSFVRCRDFKHCAQSRFDKGQESWRRFVGCGEVADGKSITHLDMYITDKNNPNVVHETMRCIFTGSLMDESLFSVVKYVMLH